MKTAHETPHSSRLNAPGPNVTTAYVVLQVPNNDAESPESATFWHEYEADEYFEGGLQQVSTCELAFMTQ